VTVIVLQLPANGYRCLDFCRLYYRSCLIVKDTCRISSQLAALHQLESPLSCFITGLISLSSSCIWTRCQVGALFCKTAMVLVSVHCLLERCGSCGQLPRLMRCFVKRRWYFVLLKFLNYEIVDRCLIPCYILLHAIQANVMKFVTGQFTSLFNLDELKVKGKPV
jgi:hypothetical protein